MRSAVNSGPLLRVPTCPNHPFTMEIWSFSLNRYIMAPICMVEEKAPALIEFDLQW
jgi:hypothetical protein